MYVHKLWVIDNQIICDGEGCWKKESNGGGG